MMNLKPVHDLSFWLRLICATTALTPLAAVAQQTEEDDTTEVVVTGYRVEASAGGTRIVTPLKDLPMSVQVVNEGLIRDTGSTKIEDAVRFVSGINKVNRNDNQGRGERFAIRGFNSSAITRNGVPFNIHSDTVNIQQIDVVKGANSILYGVNDPGGVIAVVTKTPQKTPHYRIDQSFGSNEYYRTQLDLNTPVNDWLSYRLMGAYTNAGSHLEHGFEEKTVVDFVAKADLSERTHLIVDYYHQNVRGRFQRDAYPMIRDTAGNFLRFANLGSDFSNIFPNNRNIDKASALELRFTHEFSDNLRLRLVGAETALSGDQFNMIGFSVTPGTESVLKFNNLLSIYDVKSRFAFAELTARFSTPWMNHRLVGGAEWKRTGMGWGLGVGGAQTSGYDVLNPPSDPAVRYYRPESRAQLLASGTVARNVPDETHAFFLTDQITLTDNRTHILVGLRYDKLRDTDHVTPQFGVSYALTDNFSVYGLYSESFRLNGTITYGPDEILRFDPEEGVNKELGLKFTAFNRRFSGQISAFDLTRQNVLQTTANPDNPTRPFISLSGEERSRGVEIDVSGKVTRRLDIFGSWSHYFESEVIRNVNPALVGLPLEGVSPNGLSLFARYDLGAVGSGRLAVNGGVIWRDGPIWQYNSLPYINMTEDGYTVFDAGLDYNLPDKGLGFSLKIHNLFDEEYFDRRAAYAAPRQVRLHIGKTF